MNSNSVNPDLLSVEKKLKKESNLEVVYGIQDPIPDSDDYFQALHDKIMAKINTIEIQPKPPLAGSAHVLKKIWNPSLSIVTMMAFLMTIGKVCLEKVYDPALNNHVVTKYQNEDALIDVITENKMVFEASIMDMPYSDHFIERDDVSMERIITSL